MMGGFVGELREVEPKRADPPERFDINAIAQDPSVCPFVLFFTDVDQQQLASVTKTDPAFHDAVQHETETFPPTPDVENYTSDEDDIKDMLNQNGQYPGCGG